MQQEKPIWKILTIIVTTIGVASSIFFYFDTKHSTEAKIVEALSERYESVDKEMSYEQALEEVDRQVKKLGSNNANLQAENDSLLSQLSSLKSENDSLQNEVSLLKTENEHFDMISLAERYAASGNYEVAIPILNSITNKTEDIVSLLKSYTEKYEITIMLDAEALANSGNYEGAIGLIDEALTIVPNSQALLAKKADLLPKYLVDTIECYQAQNLWRLDSRESIKMSGKSYRHAIFSQSSDVVGSMFNNAYSANAYYNLDGKYIQLSGVAGHIDFSGSGTIGSNDAGQVYDAEITIWGDDKELYTIRLSSHDTAQEFNISIAGVKILEFRIKCNGNSKVGIAEIQIR